MLALLLTDSYLVPRRIARQLSEHLVLTSLMLQVDSLACQSLALNSCLQDGLNASLWAWGAAASAA
jgi:hypothetical protein